MESAGWLVVSVALRAPGLRGTEIRKLTSASPLGRSTTTGTLVTRPTSRTSLAPSSPSSAGGPARRSRTASARVRLLRAAVGAGLIFVSVVVSVVVTVHLLGTT